jgi:hypothetical protein
MRTACPLPRTISGIGGVAGTVVGRGASINTTASLKNV